MNDIRIQDIEETHHFQAISASLTLDTMSRYITRVETENAYLSKTDAVNKYTTLSELRKLSNTLNGVINQVADGIVRNTNTDYLSKVDATNS